MSIKLLLIKHCLAINHVAYLPITMKLANCLNNVLNHIPRFIILMCRNYIIIIYPKSTSTMSYYIIKKARQVT